MNTNPVTPPIDRLLARMRGIERVNGCWLWPGANNGRGYGVIGRGAYRAGMVYVHRIMYEHVHGEIPSGMEVCHRCDVRNCVAPEHLFVGTHSANVTDSVNKGRHRKGRDMYWSVKLTEDNVREIRRLHSEGRTASSLARQFGVSSSQAEFIVNRKRWKHVV